MKNLYVVFAAAIVLLFGCRKQASDQLAPENTGEIPSAKAENFFKVPEHPKFKPNEIKVKFKNNNQRTSLGRYAYRYVQTAAMKKENYNGYYLVGVKDPEAEVMRFKKSQEVEWAELNYVHTTQQLNDPYLPDQWGLHNAKVPAMWEGGNYGKETVYVGVIDEGAMYWHNDLNGKYWTNPGEIAGNNIDDDHNGYVDDIHGYNWFNGVGEVYTGNDDHGTWCGGAIGAKSNNGIGVSGFAPNVKLIALKFLADYGYDDGAIQAIDYAIDLKSRYNLNIRVLSNSWGGGGYSQGMVDAIKRAGNAGIIFVCAAGNSNLNTETSPMYPAGYDIDNIVSVGALNSDDTKAWFSNYGNVGPSAVDLFAPGVNMWSTLPTSTHTPGYGRYSGTSMATPQVSAAAAAWFSVNPTGTVAQCKAALMNSVRKVDALTGYCLTGGTLDVSTFIGNNPLVPQDANAGTPPFIDAEKPTPQTDFKVTGWTIDSVNLTADVHYEWKNGTDNVYVAQNFMWLVDNYWQVWIPADWTSVTLGGVPLDKYDSYMHSIDTWNNWSDSSNHARYDLTIPLIPDTEPPTTPTNLTTTTIGTNSIGLTWTASTDNVGVHHYAVNYRKSPNGTWFLFNTSSNSYNLSGLQEGTAYDINVQAWDVQGNRSGFSETITATTLVAPPPPPPPPPACTIASTLSATSQALNVTVTWSITGDCTVSSTRLERKKGNGSFSAVAFDPTSPYKDVVPTPGSYTYRLQIVTTTGQTVYSNEKAIKVNKK